MRTAAVRIGKEAARKKTLDMLKACFRHQHPENFRRAMIEIPREATELIYGPDPEFVQGRYIEEEPMGDPHAH